VVNNGPESKTYPDSTISLAIEEAVNAINSGTQYQRNGKGAAYPHQNTPGQGSGTTTSWADFNLPECSDGTDKQLNYGFIEYPILRSDQVWKGGSKEQGPDRVLFQFVTDPNQEQTYTGAFSQIKGKYLHAAYCGMINHVPKADNSGYSNAFATCENSRGGN
jgi:hypothetical protein